MIGLFNPFENLFCSFWLINIGLSDLIPEVKPGGRKRGVDMWEVINAIFYIWLEGVRCPSLPGDFAAWQTVYTYFRNWRNVFNAYCVKDLAILVNIFNN